MNTKLIVAGLLALALIGGGAYAISGMGKKTKDIKDSVATAGYGQGKMQGSSNPNNGNMQRQQNQTNKDNCLGDNCLLVENLEYPAGELTEEAQDAINKAIDDEYKALATYEAVIEKFGSVRPFSMIKGAEEQHIASLKAVFDKYGVDIPANDHTGSVLAPNTLQEACQIGVEAEISNAELYREELLPAVSEYEDIAGVFNNLMNASQEKHLPAFERCN